MSNLFKLSIPRGFINFGSRLNIEPVTLKVQAGISERLLFITDIHLRKNNMDLLSKIVNASVKAKPTMILFGGDFAEFNDGLEIVMNAFRTAFPDIPFIAVRGNNESHVCTGEAQKQREIAAKYNCSYLVNDSIMVNNIELVGVDDVYLGQPSSKGLFSNKHDTFRILLSHAPHSFLLEECENKPDLMLSGHTHGGQINIFGFTCYFAGYERQYDYTHIAGVKRIGKTVCIVSRGIGVSKFPLRIGAAPELYLIGKDLENKI